MVKTLANLGAGITRASDVTGSHTISRRVGILTLFYVPYISGALIVKKTISLVIVALLLGLCVMGQVPQQTPLTSKEAPQPATAEAPANRVPDMTATDVEAFLDGLVPQQISHDDIA